MSWLPRTSEAKELDLNLLEATTLVQEPSQWVILDARPRKVYREGHLPEALSFPWEDYTRTDADGVPYRTFPPEELAAALGQLGISEQTPLLVYGDADSSWGGEGLLCWALAWLGHQGPVRLLNGGIQQWQQLGYPITNQETILATTAAAYHVTLHPELNISAAEITSQQESLVLIDTRSSMEWLMGRIPKAIHIDWKDFSHGSDNRPLSADELNRLLQDNGVPAEAKIVYYCTGGVRSGYAWLVHQLAGRPTAVNFEGGIEEWNRRP